MSNILVVDDDTSILVFIEQALTDTHQVFTSETVAGAEEISNNNSIDLLIADLVMPEKNGIDMIMEFRKIHPAIKILAISGGGGITGRFDYLPIAKLVGAEDTLKKPFTITELRSSINTILEISN
ncbi:MAG: response regulator [endosymbiont of Galathealinum brachiosum]|uniref:Response regulator n=1 Tax=endosymbiont of Galathealinum brachiosum TaxID=2200906 RepID=A0A370DK63_9GAMM|nr:MAG: response regulator [endosymbiont of Galathealinum brachiosum]